VHKNGDKKQNFSTLLSSELNLDYNYLSTIFSGVENITIEHYIINLKVERVKELLVYDEKTLSEIAWELGYSSVAHLSGQFKKVTGFTPSYFKNLGEQKRKSIDSL
jgi:AraC-like DNA-binding protein